MIGGESSLQPGAPVSGFDFNEGAGVGDRMVHEGFDESTRWDMMSDSKCWLEKFRPAPVLSPSVRQRS